MKRLVKLSMCFLLMLEVSGIQEVCAEEPTTYTGDAEKIFDLSNITDEDFDVRSDYSQDYMKDENAKVYYQQYTGINTLNATGLDTELVRGWLGIDNEVTDSLFYPEYKISTQIINNPAESKDFINTPQEFVIDVEIKISNNVGDEKVFRKTIPAEVVEIQGEIISHKEGYLGRSYSLQYNKANFDEIFASFWDNQEVAKAKKYDGTIVDVPTFATMAIGLGFGFQAEAPYGYGLKDSYYDLHYKVNRTDFSDTNFFSNSLRTGFIIYLIDENNNLVNSEGEVVVPFEEREDTIYQSNNSNIGISAKEGTLPKGSNLVVEEINNLELKKPYVAYDLNVFANDEKVQPIGEVTLTFNLNDELKGKNVSAFYLDDNGKYEELDSKVENDKITFNTAHFSKYVVTEKDNIQKENTDNVETTTPNTDDNVTSDEKVDVKTNADVKKDSNAIKDTGLDTATTTKGIAISILAFGILAYVVIAKRKKA